MKTLRLKNTPTTDSGWVLATVVIAVCLLGYHVPLVPTAIIATLAGATVNFILMFLAVWFEEQAEKRTKLNR